MANKNALGPSLSRRDFLRLAGIASGGLALTACGLDPTKFPDPTATAAAMAAEPIGTSTVHPTLEVVLPGDIIDVSIIGGQQEVIKYGTFSGNTYSYDFVSQSITAPTGIEMTGSAKVAFTANAQSLISVLGEPADFVDVKTSGQAGANSRNTALAFKTESNGESMFWASAFGENSSSPDWSFSTPNVTAKDVTYNKFPLPPGVSHNGITIRFILGGPIENKIVQGTATDGTVWVFNPKQGEWIKMIDQPQGEFAKPIVDNYGEKFAAIYPEMQVDFSPDAINERLMAAEPETYTAADGSTFKALSDPLTGQHLFIRTIDAQTKEWGEWREMTSRSVLELGVKPGDSFKYLGARYSDVFFSDVYARIPSEQIDAAIATEFNMGYLMDSLYHQTEKRENQFTLQNAIDAGESAHQNGMTTIGGPLVYGKSDFDYTYLKEKRSTLTRDELLDIMKRHIKTQMEGTVGSVDIMIVVNEFLPKEILDQTWENPEKLPYDKYAAIIGDDYIDIAFEYAREIDTKGGTVPPSTILIYNGTANHLPQGNTYWEGDNTNVTMEIVNRLRDKGLIDGVGVQLHIDASKPPNIEKMIQTLKNYGMPVYITEFDIDVQRINGSDAQKERIRADLYKQIMEGILKSEVVEGATHWSALQEAGGTAQLFDEHLQPMPSLFNEREALFDHFFGK